MTTKDRCLRLREVFDSQKAKRWKMAQSTASERIARLVALRNALWARREGFHQAIHADFGKNPAETDLTEIFPVLAEINHTVKHLKSWMKPTRAGRPWALLGTHSEVRYEAKGLVLVLSPWNYPVNLLLNPVVAAIAAGNCVIAKPSSKVPHTARFLKDFFSETFPEDEVALFEGDSQVADALLEFPFDHIFFTGSPRIGKVVMAAAAKHLASVTLELGGKSPVIVDPSADLRKVAERVCWGKFVNAGQTCVAPDYMLLHESLKESFLREARKVLESRYGVTEDQRKTSPDYCRAVSSGHLAGLIRVLDASVAAGARIEIGGVTDPDQRYLSPTILTGVHRDSPIMEEEIFGPILPVLTYSSLDEALELVRSREKPLALYVFASDRAVVDKVLSGTTAGGTCVNSVMLHVANPDLPFGGVGNSGMGSYHGIFGFQSLSHPRAVLRQGWLDSLKFFYPPYTASLKRRILLAMKYLGR